MPTRADRAAAQWSYRRRRSGVDGKGRAGESAHDSREGIRSEGERARGGPPRRSARRRRRPRHRPARDPRVEALKPGAVGSGELLDRYLARVERLHPRLNAIVTLDVERARIAADAADAARARGEMLGPLHGLPMTVKDTLETAGVRTTAGA